MEDDIVSSLRSQLDQHGIFSSHVDVMTDRLSDVEKIRDSVSSRISEEEQYDTTKFALKKLIPIVCRGDVDGLRKALAEPLVNGCAVGETMDRPHRGSVAKSVQLRSSSAQSAPVTCQSLGGCCTSSGKRRPADPNFICPFSGQSLLHYAALANQPAIVRLLLEHGADPNQTTDTKSSKSPTTPLYVAVYLRNSDSVSALIESGARVTKDLWQCLHKPNPHGPSDEILEILLQDGRSFLPVDDAIAISANSETPIPLIMRPGICRWRPFDMSGGLVFTLLKSSKARDVLRTQTYTAEETLFKASILQYLLHCVCHCDRDALPALGHGIFIPACLSLVDALVTAGASPVGWSVRQFEMFTTAWEQVANSLDSGKMIQRRKSPLYKLRRHVAVRRKLYSAPRSIFCCENDSRQLEYVLCSGMGTNMVPGQFFLPCLLPAVVRLIRRGLCDDDDPVAERLIQLANRRAPCVIQTPGQVRYACGYPHNGPGCSHVSLSEEQKSTSLQMCSYSFSHVPSLSAL